MNIGKSPIGRRIEKSITLNDQLVPKSLILADLQCAFLILAIGSGSAFFFLNEAIVLFLHKFCVMLHNAFSG